MRQQEHVYHIHVYRCRGVFLGLRQRVVYGRSTGRATFSGVTDNEAWDISVSPSAGWTIGHSGFISMQVTVDEACGVMPRKREQRLADRSMSSFI